MKKNSQEFNKSSLKINKIDRFGMTPLLHSIIEGNTEEIHKLIEKGADINFAQAKNKFYTSVNTPVGTTALHMAAALGFPTIVDLLIKNKADVNAVDSLGISPLDRALSMKVKNEKRLRNYKIPIPYLIPTKNKIKENLNNYNKIINELILSGAKTSFFKMPKRLEEESNKIDKQKDFVREALKDKQNRSIQEALKKKKDNTHLDKGFPKPPKLN